MYGETIHVRQILAKLWSLTLSIFSSTGQRSVELMRYPFVCRPTVRPSVRPSVCLSVCLSVRPSVRLSVRLSVQSKLNLGYNFSTNRDKALILHRLVPSDKTFLKFLSLPKNLTLWPWPWLLTYFCKNLTLAITFEPRGIRLSCYRHAFLATRPFCPYQKFLPCDLDLDFWPTFEKKLNLGYNLWTKRDKAFILHMLVPCYKNFLSVPKKLTL